MWFKENKLIRKVISKFYKCRFQDDLYNSTAKKGSIYHRIKNKFGSKKGKGPNEIVNEDELLEFLKYCVVHKNKKMLKEKLEATIELRRKLLKESSADFQEFMTFYFVDPEMVRTIFLFDI